ncbi:MAG: flagellar motor switch phosphatase FliY [Lachnospiraceae bacterium]|nr:flagellar motor switch phosphatase FliY [Lachnospiraceae bacterium]
MDGMLSQDEINALLGGLDNSDGADAGTSETAAPEAAAPESAAIDENLLTDMEKDAVGEVANISMGTSATTLYSLVNRKVDITTPVVTLANLDTVIKDYPKPCVFISIKYTEGLDGSNILVLKEHDVKVITDLMMGGDGTNTDGELGELHLSAISEAMNQMMGSSATSLSSMLGKKIDISPPDATLVDLIELRDQGQLSGFLAGTFVKVAFRMQIDELVDSTIMQLYPIDFAKSIYETVMSTQTGGAAAAEPAPAPQSTPAPQSAPAPQPQMSAPDMSGQGMGAMDMNQMQMGMNQMQMGMNPMMMGMNPMMMGMNPMMMGQQMQNVNVQPAQFQSFNRDVPGIQNQENIGLIRDVPLEVTVELGRTSKSIAEILEFAPGTIIELDKIAGEPIDVLVNGKFVARGEVVVIEESFGVRVTEIIK